MHQKYLYKEGAILKRRLLHVLFMNPHLTLHFDIHFKQPHNKSSYKYDPPPPAADPQAAPRVDCACGPVRRLRPPRRARRLQHPPRGRRPHALQESHRCSGN